jgi:hypothetical protein
VLEVSRRFNAQNTWPDGPWKDECVGITKDYLRLPFDEQGQVLALEDYVGHYVLNRRTAMPFPFSYLPAEELINRFTSAGFVERRADFELFGQAPIIRRGPPTARFMFEKPRPW